MTGLLRRLLATQALSVAAFGTDGQWGEIDGPEDVVLYENMVRSGELILEQCLSCKRTRGGS
jgi:hypothetical protein